ncbi:uncharacterized protein LTR77_009922 [Saxophila tyrrhenica]|uniref:RRM domain-containing protein n=1 Tax=Saxophila tyrrhenica TaxID=1690608 RepID=A0AAV9P092_9PEZI|nr:hypothetical protein LTR77_009922 [Saxophila tyrrhenica]
MPSLTIEIPSTPVKRGPGHVRSASDPAPSTATSTTTGGIFTPCGSDDGLDGPVDSAIGSDMATSPRTTSPAPKHADTPQAPKKPKHLRSLAGRIRALGPSCVTYGQPNVKTANIKLRAAQMIFPPQMCLFVGNLPAHWSDGMLYQAISFEFKQFGACVVGVFRKAANKPYAIVQYMDICDAYTAMLFGTNIWMERPLRVEWSARSQASHA